MTRAEYHKELRTMTSVRLTPGERAMLATWSIDAHQNLTDTIRNAIKHGESEDFIQALYNSHDAANALRKRLGLTERRLPDFPEPERCQVIVDIDF
jgi:queuine/archaeosine tRNA-ribosyltransferase